MVRITLLLAVACKAAPSDPERICTAYQQGLTTHSLADFFEHSMPPWTSGRRRTVFDGTDAVWVELHADDQRVNIYPPDVTVDSEPLHVFTNAPLADPPAILLGDLNGDDKRDAVFWTADEVSILFGPFGATTDASEPDVRWSSEFIADVRIVGDLSGDDVQDLVVLRQDDFSRIHLCAVTPTPTDVESCYATLDLPGPPRSIPWITDGDVTGDGATDLAVLHSPSGQMQRVFVLASPIPPGDSEATFETLADPVYYERTQLRAMDLTGDGIDELIVFHPQDGQLWTYTGPIEADQAIEDGAVLGLRGGPAKAQIATFGDADGNGLRELLVSWTYTVDPRTYGSPILDRLRAFELQDDVIYPRMTIESVPSEGFDLLGDTLPPDTPSWIPLRWANQGRDTRSVGIDPCRLL